MRTFHAVPVIAALLGSSTAVAIGQPQSPAGTPKFEVAAVKPCKGNFDPGFKGASGTQSPGRLDLNCQTLRVFITRAYVYYGDGYFNPFRSLPEIDGAPDWIDDRYSITAIPASSASQDMMNGPMMQALLEDRFKLKIHREIKEIPVYELTVAKGGLKLPRFRPGECIPIDWTKVPVVLPPDQKNCINRTTKKGANMTVQHDASSIEAFSKLVLSGRLDRPVIDKTGLTGLFDFHLEYTSGEVDNDISTASDPSRPSIFTALQQQLGLKLAPAKGTGEFLVIDHVQRPSEN